MPVPSLPNALWEHIVYSSRVNTDLLSVCVCTRDATLRMVRQTHDLNERQAWAFCKIIYLRRPAIHIGGGAGVGKSHVLRKLVDCFARNHGTETVALVAPTGAASLVCSTASVRAHTVHRFFSVRKVRRGTCTPPFICMHQTSLEHELLKFCPEPGNIESNDECRGVETSVIDADTRKRLRAVHLLVIDEGSMLDAKFFELMSAAMQHAKCSRRPFGGVSVVVVADFHQFEPVNCHGSSKWLFDSVLWRPFQTTELQEVVRQRGDAPFAAVLNRMRTGDVRSSDIAWVNEHASKIDRTPLLTIVPTNRAADTINDAALARMDGQVYAYEPIAGLEEVVERRPRWRTRTYRARTKDSPITRPKAHGTLRLRVNAVVCATKNVYRKGGGGLEMANGQRGRVVALSANHVDVLWQAIGSAASKRTRVVRFKSMHRQAFKSRSGRPVLAVSQQFPLKLGFAITLHKAQGSSIDGPVDILTRFVAPDTDSNNGGNAPPRWQSKCAAAYVALSRATKISNVRLLEPLRMSDVRVNPAVKAHFPVC